jgi:hypothetical protein
VKQLSLRQDQAIVAKLFGAAQIFPPFCVPLVPVAPLRAPITLIMDRLLATLEHVRRGHAADCQMQSLSVVIVHEAANRPFRIVDRERR